MQAKKNNIHKLGNRIALWLSHNPTDNFVWCCARSAEQQLFHQIKYLLEYLSLSTYYTLFVRILVRLLIFFSSSFFCTKTILHCRRWDVGLGAGSNDNFGVDRLLLVAISPLFVCNEIHMHAIAGNFLSCSILCEHSPDMFWFHYTAFLRSCYL